MSLALKTLLATIAALGVSAGTVVYVAQLSPDNWIYQGGNTRTAASMALPARSSVPVFHSQLSPMAPIGSSGAAARPTDLLKLLRLESPLVGDSFFLAASVGGLVFRIRAR